MPTEANNVHSRDGHLRNATKLAVWFSQVAGATLLPRSSYWLLRVFKTTLPLPALLVYRELPITLQPMGSQKSRTQLRT